MEKKDDCKILYSFFLDKKSEKKHKKYLKDYDTIHISSYSFLEFKKGEIIKIQLATSIYAKVKITSIEKEFLIDTVGYFYGLTYNISIIKVWNGSWL